MKDKHTRPECDAIQITHHRGLEGSHTRCRSCSGDWLEVEYFKYKTGARRYLRVAS